VLFGYIVDPENGKIVAVIRHGEVFRNDKDEARIAIVLGSFDGRSGCMRGRGG
jgi:hypothetical protein